MMKMMEYEVRKQRSVVVCDMKVIFPMRLTGSR